MSVMLQAFHWDCPAKEEKVGEWWRMTKPGGVLSL